MIALMTILYVALIWLVFSIFKVRPRPWPIAAFAALGVLLIGGIVVLWLLAAPLSHRAVVTRFVVQIVPYVKGQVTSIPAQPNAPLAKGDVLYKIDPAPYQHQVDQLTAQLQAAKSGVLQAEAAVRMAHAAVGKAQADVNLSKSTLEMDQELRRQDPGSVSKLKLDQDQARVGVGEAELQQAQAGVDQAQSALAGAKATVTSTAAQLATAQFNLQECTVTAPADGFITDWQIREGTFVVPLPLAAAGTFVDTSATTIVASFPAQQLIHVQPEQKVELAFKSHPGHLFLGKVAEIIAASGEGQFAPGGKLPSAATIGSPGYLAVKIRLDDADVARHLAMGTPATVAIYTNWGRPFAMISKVAVRMQKWLYYLPLPSN